MKTLYLTQAGDDGPVRVALATDTAIERLQAGNHQPLITRRIYEATTDAVRRLHERYAPHHVRGDWFAAAVLDDPPELLEIEFDRDAQVRRLAEAERAERHRGAALALAHLATRRSA